jgi:hypothetical protein
LVGTTEESERRSGSLSRLAGLLGIKSWDGTETISKPFPALSPRFSC